MMKVVEAVEEVVVVEEAVEEVVNCNGPGLMEVLLIMKSSAQKGWKTLSTPALGWERTGIIRSAVEKLGTMKTVAFNYLQFAS